MKKLREKGITLVALVVTIIILLILAGVALRLALSENGLFKMASQSGEIARDVSEEEKVKLAVSGAFLEGTGTLTKANVEKALENEFGELEEGQLSGEEKGPWTFTGKRKTYEISGGGDIEELKEKTVADLVVGDWVKYESAQGSLTCRVLYDTEYNTSNGTIYGVQIISAKNVKEITLGDSADFDAAFGSYNHAIETLNEEARSYINRATNYVSEARCVGSDPSNPSNQGAEVSHEAVNDECCINGRDTILEDNNKDTDVEQLAKLYSTDGVEELGYFWLASRCVDRYSSSDRGLWKHDWDDGPSKETIIFTACGEEDYYDPSYGFRPVFKLNPDVKIKNGVGDGKTKDTAYELYL